jgi:hypothetical protein
LVRPTAKIQKIRWEESEMRSIRQRFIDRQVAEAYISKTVLSLLTTLGIPVISAA